MSAFECFLTGLVIFLMIVPYLRSVRRLVGAPPRSTFTVQPLELTAIRVEIACIHFEPGDILYIRPRRPLCDAHKIAICAGLRAIVPPHVHVLLAEPYLDVLKIAAAARGPSASMGGPQ